MNRAQVLRRLATEMMLPVGVLALGVGVFRRLYKSDPDGRPRPLETIPIIMPPQNHRNFPLGTGPDTRLLHHQLVALSRLSPTDREILLDYMDAARSRSPQQTAHRGISDAWNDLDKGTFESSYKGPIDEAVVQSWSGAYRVLIDSMKRARGDFTAPSVGADYVP